MLILSIAFLSFYCLHFLCIFTSTLLRAYLLNVTVRPLFEDAFPHTYTPRGANLLTACKSWLFPKPGSPTNNTWELPRTGILSLSLSSFWLPPNKLSKRPAYKSLRALITNWVLSVCRISRLVLSNLLSGDGTQKSSTEIQQIRPEGGDKRAKNGKERPFYIYVTSYTNVT